MFTIVFCTARDIEVRIIFHQEVLSDDKTLTSQDDVNVKVCQNRNSSHCFQNVYKGLKENSC